MKHLSLLDFYATVASGKQEVSSSQNLVMPAEGREQERHVLHRRRSTSTCVHAAMAPWDAAARKSMLRSRPDMKRPKMGAWDECGRACWKADRAWCLHSHADDGFLRMRAMAQATGPWGIGGTRGSQSLPGLCRSTQPAILGYQGKGFENKLAELFARKLNEPVSYTYFPQVIGFVRNTLNALRCDVIIGTAVGDTTVQTTNPYYHTTYALVFKPDSGLDGIESLEDPRLKDKQIGIVAGTPPATVLAADGLMADATPYPLTVDTRVDLVATDDDG